MSSSAAEMRPITDALDRPLASLRVSVTDRCNLRCQYCMPEEEYVWLPREGLLTFEEIRELVAIFTELGADKVRLTGGEPLLRRDLPALARMLAKTRGVKDLAITTNGVLLAEHAQALYEAGLHRVTVSLDTLRPERFRALTRRDAHGSVLSGIEAVRRVGLEGLKLDTVVMRGVNEDELADLLEYGKRVGAEARFIEYMDVGGATQWSRDKVFSRAEILEVLGRRYGRIDPIIEVSSAPAERFVLPDGTVFPSSPRQPPHSAGPATEVDSRQMGSGSCASTLKGGSTCGSRYGTGPRGRRSRPSSCPGGQGGETVAPKSGRSWKRWVSEASWSKSKASERTLTSKCTRGEDSRWPRPHVPGLRSIRL